jgi:hypothetical protein
MHFIGIDPGKTGAIAVLSEAGAIVDVTKMPDTLQGILDFLEGYSTNSDGRFAARAALEFVRASPQMGVVSVSTFMRNYGHLEMALTAAKIPYYDVHPLRWQKVLDCRSGGDKNITKDRAIALWPGQKITHAIADALLLAEWVRRGTIGQQSLV